MTAELPILIVGGGIGGLAAAIALARRKQRSTIFEKRRDGVEAGAGIQLGPNAVGALERLGVSKRLAPNAGRPETIDVRDGGTGATLARLPLGGWIAERHGAPYWTVHRQDLHDALRMTAADLDAIDFVPEFEVAAVTEREDRVFVRSRDGQQREGRALVGADGLGSMARAVLHGAIPLPPSGKTATRTVIDAADVREPLSLIETGVWLADRLHVVHYPVAGGRALAVVAIVDEGWSAQGWNTPVPADRLMAKLAPLVRPLQAALARSSGWHMWALPAPIELPFWSRGRVTLLGDAAHPILPFLAQGGALAIEDAEVLAACIAASGNDLPAALRRYQSERMDRATRVQRASTRNGRIYHLNGAARMARDMTLRTVPGRMLMAQLDWLYGWQPEVAAGRSPG
jgi:salicylate hydroxylase